MENIIKEVFWTNRALKDLSKTMLFYGELYGEEKAKEIAYKIHKRTSVLVEEKYTRIGAIDESFSHLKHQYRKLIEEHCKITYREGKNKVYIVRIFDTRQNPSKNR